MESSQFQRDHLTAQLSHMPEEIQGSANDQQLTSCDCTDLGKYCGAEIIRFTNEQKYWILKHALDLA